MKGLPLELLQHVFKWIPRELYNGTCSRVCHQWRDAVRSMRPVLWRNRFYAYERKWIFPKLFKNAELPPHIAVSDIRCLAVGQDGRIYSGSMNGMIQVWNPDGTLEQTLQEWNSCICSIAVVGQHIYSGSWDGSIRVWDGTQSQTFEKDQYPCYGLAVGKDGRIYSCGHDPKVHVWSADGKHLQTLKGHKDWVMAIAVGKDGKIYTGSDDETIRVWSGTDGTHLQTLEGHTDYVRAIAVGPDGCICSGSEDGAIRVWSGMDGTLLQTFKAHRDVISLVVGNDHIIYSGSLNEICVWSPIGVHLHTLEGDTDWQIALTIGLDGRIYSGSWMSTIQMW